MHCLIIYGVMLSHIYKAKLVTENFLQPEVSQRAQMGSHGQ